MSTSENQTAKNWILWQPINLSEESLSVPSSVPVISTESSEAATALTPQIELSLLQQQAEQAGFVEGERRGFEQGQQAGYDAGKSLGITEARAAETAQLVAQRAQAAQEIKQLFRNVQEALDSLDYIVPSRLFQLALTVVHTMLGQQVLSDSVHQNLLERVQRLLAEESLFQHRTQMWISPEDEPLIAEQFSQTLAERGWCLKIDKHMLPGGCRITCDEGERDESLETRWKVLCTLLREENCP